MFDKQRDQIARALAECRVGVLSAAGAMGPQAVPVQYRVSGLVVECILPRWSDLVYTLEEPNQVVLVVLFARDSDRRWILYQGVAKRIDDPDWAALAPGEGEPADRYTAIRIHPTQVDLIDQDRGWGARETLDLA